MKFFERAVPTMAAMGSISVPKNFGLVSQDMPLNNQTSAASVQSGAQSPSMSVIINAFRGAYRGNGFNTIFRPQGNATFHTVFNNTVGASTNVLELNLMNETLVFTQDDGLANIPNRGLGDQTDIALRAVPYVQSIDDQTNTFTGRAPRNDSEPHKGIHFEPGIWLVVPSLDPNPKQAQSLNRLGSIPHGTVINAQGLEPTSSTQGAPDIPSVDITPFRIGDPSMKRRFPSQTADNQTTPRLPQDLTLFIKAGTITQDILNNTNLVLRNHLRGQKVVNTTTFSVTTQSDSPLRGGGLANQAFLVGKDDNSPNARPSLMSATFWIETVQWTVTVPVSNAGQTMVLKPIAPNPDVQLPSFSVTPPYNVRRAMNVTAFSTQIQYSQLVNLDFAGLTWPHVSVNTLAPVEPIPLSI